VALIGGAVAQLANVVETPGPENRLAGDPTGGLQLLATALLAKPNERATGRIANAESNERLIPKPP